MRNVHFRLFLLIAISQLLTACTSLQTGNQDELEDPGWFDVGIGAAQIFNVASGDDNDASGFMTSVKAYPFGRWYSTPKSQTQLIIETKSIDGKVTISGDNQSVSIAGANLDELAGFIRNDNSFEIRVFCKKESDEKEICRGEPYHRLSVFAGISSDNFTGANLDSPVYSIGVGFDVAPGFALVAGMGWYDYTDDAINSRTDSDTSFLFGFQLNLKAFEALWKTSNN